MWAGRMVQWCSPNHREVRAGLSGWRTARDPIRRGNRTVRCGSVGGRRAWAGMPVQRGNSTGNILIFVCVSFL